MNGSDEQESSPEAWVTEYGLWCHLSPYMLVKLRFFVDSFRADRRLQ
jgi:hypothetical protein